MTDLDEFLQWGNRLMQTEERDSFGNRFTVFPSGTISYWISEYKNHVRKTGPKDPGRSHWSV